LKENTGSVLGFAEFAPCLLIYLKKNCNWDIFTHCMMLPVNCLPFEAESMANQT